ncbi:MAG: flagellar protein FlgN [Sedimenticolaceae bacterium]
MDRTQLSKAFTATVQASLHGLQSLEPVLEQELTALGGRNAAALDRIVAGKLELLRQIEHSVHARDRLQEVAGFTQGLDGGKQLVEAFDQDALTAEWGALVALAQRIAVLNDRNGQLAMQGQRATRTALSILTGRKDRQDTYSTLRHGRDAATRYSLGKV